MNDQISNKNLEAVCSEKNGEIYYGELSRRECPCFFDKLEGNVIKAERVIKIRDREIFIYGWDPYYLRCASAKSCDNYSCPYIDGHPKTCNDIRDMFLS